VIESSYLIVYIEYIVKGGFPLKVDYYVLIFFIILKKLVHNIWYQSINLKVLLLQVSHLGILAITFVVEFFRK
jgi:hypothetical protein